MDGLLPEQLISIHAPRTGSDGSAAKSSGHSAYFNLRSPHGERRAHADALPVVQVYINPRSPHGERLFTVPQVLEQTRDFNPRSPHGERQVLPLQVMESGAFQSTLPARGATVSRWRS